MKFIILALSLSFLSIRAFSEEICVPQNWVYAPPEFSGLDFPLAQPWFEHYIACREGFLQWDQFYTQCLAELEAFKNPIDPICDDFIDGRGGRVWKPISESTGRVVFLMEKGFLGREAKIFDRLGKVIAKATYRGNTNGDRPTFDLDKYARQLKPLVVNFGFICLSVKNPLERYD